MRNPSANRETPYFHIYKSLQQAREVFHREGRISDSNAKLDETIKFLTVHFGRDRGLITDDDFNALSKYETFTVALLNQVFSKVAGASYFKRTGMVSIFGESPSTFFREGDEKIAYELFRVTQHSFATQANMNTSFDALNEAFGHFVRDNFRNNIEDAQYMTPPEVVEFMVKLAIELTSKTISNIGDKFLVADPSCGVGSFLVTWRKIFEQKFGFQRAQQLKCIGQDKVERMVRLCAINLVFLENANDDVFLGNSIDDRSPIGEYNGKIDLILTNPPFGARFPVAMLKQTSTQSTPFFTNVLASSKYVDSELLFLDRYLSLLKPSGLCLAVVPDGVVSAKGLAAMTRQFLARNAELLGVVELPSVTFAQAGTRTKTAILAFRKEHSPREAYPVFFSEAADLGYKVSRRKGVPIKTSQGVNELPKIFQAFQTSSGCGEPHAQFAKNGMFKEISPLEHSVWTPRTMLFDQKTLEMEHSEKLLPLRELIEIRPKRKVRRYSKGSYFISVLHIIGEGILDIPGIKSYEPITPGFPVEPGEILFSRINPRIPRVVVVPDLGREILCSAEFEILSPRSDVSAYRIAFFLLSPIVQVQIQTLTAGTSASHSRIKPRRVYDVLVPDFRSLNTLQMDRKFERYEKCIRDATRSLIEIEGIRKSLDVTMSLTKGD